MAELKFKVGDKVHDEKYGFGVVCQVDPHNKAYPYYVKYKDGTRIWYDGKNMKPAAEGKERSEERRVGKECRL